MIIQLCVSEGFYVITICSSQCACIFYLASMSLTSLMDLIFFIQYFMIFSMKFLKILHSKKLAIAHNWKIDFFIKINLTSISFFTLELMKKKRKTCDFKFNFKKLTIMDENKLFWGNFIEISSDIYFQKVKLIDSCQGLEKSLSNHLTPIYFTTWLEKLQHLQIESLNNYVTGRFTNILC